MAALITAKAGRCFAASSDSKRIVPSETPGTISLKVNQDDELLHFMWTPRKGATVDEDFDLIVLPGDASFVPYSHGSNTSGRIFVLKFSSSSQRHFFWLQTKAEGAANELSRSDKLLGKKIDRLLQNGGDTEDVIADDDLLAEDGPSKSMDIDEDPTSHGEDSRQGGGDGGRAANEDIPTTIPHSTTAITSKTKSEVPSDFLQSLLRGISVPTQQQSQSHQPTSILSLPGLLPPSTTTSLLDSSELRKSLLENLPPTLTKDIKTEGQEKELLRRVLHSPQFSQAAVGMTVALREGGLRGVADSLGVKLDLSAASAQGGVEMFLEGIKSGVEKDLEVEKKKTKKDDDGDEEMGGGAS